MGAGPAKGTINGQDACRSKTQINYKNKGFGRSGWFCKPLNYFIKIDLSRVHYLEKCLFSRISAFLDRPCSAERRVLKLQNARNKAFLVILCRIGCRFARQAHARHTLGGGPKVLFLKHFGALMSCGLKSFWRALLGLYGALWGSLALSKPLRAPQRLPHKGCPTKAAPQRLPHKGCPTKAPPQRLPHNGPPTKAALQSLPQRLPEPL